MKKLLKLKYTAWSFILLGVSMLQSCSDDDIFDVTGSKENKVYINTRSWNPVDAPKNSMVFNVTNTPVGSTIVNADKIEAKFAVQCTHVAASDIVVRFEIDNSLIASGYSALPNGVTVAMDKSELTIPRGSTVSGDSITISVSSDKLGLLTAGQYMAPIRIISVTNAQPSENLTSAFLLVKASFTNCVDQATGAPGTAASSAGWMATVNGANQGTKLFDNRQNTYFFGGNFTLIVDFGSILENIAGFKLNFYAWYYAMGSAKIYTSSTTPDAFELQGSPTFPAATPQYVRFYGPVRARYVKVEVTSPSYSSDYGTAITEFNVYQQ